MACCRRRRGVAARGPHVPGEDALVPEVDSDDPVENPGPRHGNEWQRLVAGIQRSRQWHARSQALNYAKHGLPRNLDGPARGLGRHVGRWGWREIASSW